MNSETNSGLNARTNSCIDSNDRSSDASDASDAYATDTQPKRVATDGGEVVKDSEQATRTGFGDLTGFQRDCLVAIAQFYGDNGHYPYGLAISSRVGDYYGRDVNHGQLYPNLDTLIEKGYLGKTERDRRTNEYYLTDEGWAELNAYIDRLEGVRR